MRFAIFIFLIMSLLVSLSSFQTEPFSVANINNDSTDLAKADKIITDADALLPKAMELKNIFEGYKARAAKKCDKAMKEASDGLDMSNKAVKDCEDAKKLVEKARKAKKSTDIHKAITTAEKEVHNAKYFIHEAEERKHETEFELKACH